MAREQRPDRETEALHVARVRLGYSEASVILGGAPSPDTHSPDGTAAIIASETAILLRFAVRIAVEDVEAGDQAFRKPFDLRSLEPHC